MLACRIPDELSLRTFEIGVTSFRLDPAKFRTIAVYGDSLAFIVSPKHRLAEGDPGVHQRSGQRKLHRP